MLSHKLFLAIAIATSVLHTGAPSMTPACLAECDVKPTPSHDGPCKTLHAVRKFLPGHTDTVNCLSVAEVEVTFPL